MKTQEVAVSSDSVARFLLPSYFVRGSWIKGHGLIRLNGNILVAQVVISWHKRLAVICYFVCIEVSLLTTQFQLRLPFFSSFL